MQVKETIRKAQTELALNRRWRAKEIVASSLKNYEYEPDLLAFYGEILLAMGDDMQAGRYLFFSKIALSEKESAAVDIFISRHSANEYKSLLRGMPGKRYKYHLLPKEIRERLVTYGATDELFNDQGGHIKGGKKDSLACTFGCIILSVILICVLCVGVYTVYSWLISLSE